MNPMGNGIEFAKSCFNERAKDIEQLACGEGFCAICNDFLIAHQEKLHWERSPAAQERGERIAEYEELMEFLRREIVQALGRAAVVPFRPQRTITPPRQ
jgi:hypothetical protein